MNWKHNKDLTEYKASHLGIKYVLKPDPCGCGWIISVIPRKIFWLRANDGFESWGDWKEHAIKIAEDIAKERNWLNIWWLKYDR